MKRHDRKSLLAALLLALAAGPSYADPLAVYQEQAFRAELKQDLQRNVEALHRLSLDAAREAGARLAAAAPGRAREADELHAPGRSLKNAGAADEYAL